MINYNSNVLNNNVLPLSCGIIVICSVVKTYVHRKNWNAFRCKFVKEHQTVTNKNYVLRLVVS